METRKLKSLPYGQAHVDVSDDGNIETLVSYNTAVILKMKKLSRFRQNGVQA